MAFMTPAPPPPSDLGRYRQLAPRAAVLVSPLSLGAMSIGQAWSKGGFGELAKEGAWSLLNSYFDNGGNFIDTANMYQDGQSEEWLGEWMQERGIRDQIVLATKYTNFDRRSDPNLKQKVSFIGNNVKSMKLSFELSLERLKTNYIDLFYVHFWDLHTSVEEIMDGLHTLILAGKVLYLGISDAPAWFVVKANEYARHNGKTPFAVYQGAYSVLQRDLEREIIPMCMDQGMGLTLWNVLAGGHIRSTEEEEKRRATGEHGRKMLSSWERTPEEIKVCDGLEVVAKEVGGKSITSVAIAWVLHKAPYMHPIIGGRKVEHLQSNIEALSVSLSPEQMAFIEQLKPFDRGFPMQLLGEFGHYHPLLAMYATMDTVPAQKPITPRQQ